MKSKRSHSINKNAGKTVCRLSAAALMLGVSQAATVGFNFQTSYCADSRYSGFPVTMTAFGVGTNNWENLTPMLTAYGCTDNTVPYTLNEVIDTTTAANGLNPLPNGSVGVTWSADGANFSGFGGYAVTTPSHGFDGAPPVPQLSGEMQIYSSFLRDGVNFGVNPNTGNGGADNNAPGYSVDITGLKTVFTNTPFVIELIASSDSMQYLTNAFIIDATAGVTNSSVAYVNTPFPSPDEGGTGGLWLRGHGGGLSTMSGTLNTDHIQIIGNRAAHGAGGAIGYDFASTIAGFIVTDKPVVTMPPQPVLVSPGDDVTLRAIAIGVPPLKMQWRKNGAVVPGATNLSFVISNVVAGAGIYDLVVTNNYGSITSKVAAVTLDRLSIAPGSGYTLDSKPTGTRHDGEVLGATILASNTDSLGTNRTGVAQFVSTDPDGIVVPTADTTDFDNTNGTIMFWMRSAGLANPSGFDAILFNRGVTGSGSVSTGVVVLQNPSGPIEIRTGAGGFVPLVGTVNVSDDNWHHVAVVNDDGFGTLIYVDGVEDTEEDNPGSWAWPASLPIVLGMSSDSFWQPYNGDLDDVRFYNRNLTAAEVASAYHTASLVDTTALKLQLNFSSAHLNPGIKVSWQNTNAVLQSATAITGPWTNAPAAVSPYQAEIQPVRTFFRYVHTPVSIQSNPYDM